MYTAAVRAIETIGYAIEPSYPSPPVALRKGGPVALRGKGERGNWIPTVSDRDRGAARSIPIFQQSTIKELQLRLKLIK